MTHPCILVVNDEPAMREFLRFNLKVRGYEVITSPGNNGGFIRLEKEQPDLVILDLMVQGVDGFDLCEKNCESGKTSVIAINMRGGEADLLKILALGVDDYLGKPFGVDELMARIRSILRGKAPSRNFKSQNLWIGAAYNECNYFIRKFY